MDAGKDRPEGLGEVLDQFERLGNELAILEYDLALCIHEFLQAYQILYEAPDALALKKLPPLVDRITGLGPRSKALLFYLGEGPDPGPLPKP